MSSPELTQRCLKSLVTRAFALAFLPAAMTAVGLLGQEIRVSSTIGELDGTDEQIFGLVEDAVFLPDDRVAVLDSRMLELRLYTTTGEHLQSLGRSGRGPGEFFVPEAVARTSEGLVVLDRGNARLTHYRQVALDSLVMAGEIPLPVHARDLCVTGGRIYIASDETEKPVVELATTGAIVREFGSAPLPPGMPVDTPPQLVQMLQHRARAGFLDCSDEGVTWASAMVGVIQHFDLDGGLQFEVQLEDFDPEAPALTARRTVRHGPREGINHIDRIKTVRHSGKVAVVQLTRADYTKREISWSSFAFDLENQRSVPILGGLGGPLHDAGVDGRLLFSREEPFPQLLIGRVNPSGEELFL